MPTGLLLLLSCVCGQDPAGRGAIGTPAPTGIDVVELKNGERLEGRVTTQVDGYVEIELRGGGTVGLGPTRIAAVHRAAGGAAPDPVPVVPSRDDWFLLHDATGASVGWLRVSVGTTAAGEVRIAEEYEFVAGQRRYAITSLAIGDSALLPRSCYFRERIAEARVAFLPVGTAAGIEQRSEHLLGERIVEATVTAKGLHVVRTDREGRRERLLDWPAGATFPLLLRERLRASSEPVALDVVSFDPGLEEFQARTLDGGRRRSVELDGRALVVTEFADTTAVGRNAEWIDASARTLRRELAGPALVAVRSSEHSARAAVGGVQIAAASVAEPQRRFGLWVPNPAWEPLPADTPGRVALRCNAHGASITLSLIEHLDRDAALDSAEAAVQRWFRLLSPELRLQRREIVSVREREAVSLEWRSDPGPGAQCATLVVIPHRGQFLALLFRAPAAACAELAADLAFVLRSVELDPEALAPRSPGPLLDVVGIPGNGPGQPVAAGNGASVVRTVPQPAPVAPPSANTAADLPLVRVPRQQ